MTSFEEEFMQPDIFAQVIIGWLPSDETDGLHFAQSSGLPRTSDQFGDIFVDELGHRDFIQVFNGTVGSGQSEFQTFYSDLPFTSSNGVFALREEPNVPAPEPARLRLLGSGLVGLAGISRKRFRKT